MTSYIQNFYIFILLFAPLAFGTTETWSKLVLSSAIFGCAALFGYDALKRGKHLLKVPGLAPLLALLGVMLLQITPLPGLVVRLISPATYTLYQETAGITGPVGWMHLTVDLKATVLMLIQFCAYVLFYVLSVQLLSRADFLKRVIAVVISFGGVLALAAILAHFSMPGKILWMRDSFHNNPFGPYVNRNHYAGLMVMLFPLAFCMLIYSKPRVSYETLREKLSEFFSYRTTNVYLLLVLAVVVMGASVFVSLSRGGIVCLSLALFLLGIFITAKNRDGRGRGVMVAVCSAMILLSVGWFGWDPIFARFDSLRDVEGHVNELRLAAWRDSLDIIKSYPVAGTGAGTFFLAHQAFRNATSGSGFFVHAHNDYLELASDLGLAGLACFTAFLVAVLLAALKRYVKRRDLFCVYLFLGALTGFAAILIHCVVEFQLQIGANALYFFFLASLCISATHTRMRHTRKKTFLRREKREWALPLFGSAAGLLFMLGFWVNAGAYVGELHFANVLAIEGQDELSGRDYESLKSRCVKAAVYDFLESYNYIVRAEAEAGLEEYDNAAVHFREALKMNPLNGGYLQSAAAFYALNSQPDLAQKFHQAAMKYDGANPRTHSYYGFWLMAQGDFESGAGEIRKAVALAPELTPDIIGRLADLDLRYGELTRALPPMVSPYIDLGDYLVEVDQIEMAQRAYRQAFNNLPNERRIRADWFVRLCGFYLLQGLKDEALQIISAGVSFLPKDSGLRYILGTIYENMGISYRAMEEYERAVILNPKNISARRRLERLQSES